MIDFTKNEDGKECLATCEMGKIFDLCYELANSSTFQRLKTMVDVKLGELQDERDRLVAMSKDENLSEDEREEAAEKSECLEDYVDYLDNLSECLNARC